MKESATSQGILEEGAVKALQNAIMRVGRGRFGAASQEIEMRLATVDDVDHLNRMLERMHEAASWAELLAAD